jgi:hypothetical protein
LGGFAALFFPFLPPTAVVFFQKGKRELSKIRAFPK